MSREVPQSVTYLGDGAYAEFAEGEFTLYTSNGYARQNEIVIDYGMLLLLLAFADRNLGKEVK